MKKTIAVLGAGSFGTVCAKFLAENGHDVRIWNWEGDQKPLDEIAQYHENKTYVPGVVLPKNIFPVYTLAEALDGATIVFYALASNVIKTVFCASLPYITKEMMLVSLTKGMDMETLDVFPRIFAGLLEEGAQKRILTISGPAIAGQLAQGKSTVMAIAGTNASACSIVKKVCDNDHVCLIPTSDIVGVELGGAFKNVYAIMLGICDGLGIALNTKSALLTFCIEEMGRVCVAMGGKKETIVGVAGLGDMIGTALSPDSRNRRFGQYIVGGLSLQDACAKVGQTVEGVESTAIFLALASKYNIHTPIALFVQHVIDGGSVVVDDVFNLCTYDS